MSGRKNNPGTIRKSFAFLKKLLTFNITTIMFGVLFLYMVITVILYETSGHVTSYQVTVGPLTKNPVCTALALRTEEVVSADNSGYVEYYAREGMQVRNNGSVYALDSKKQKSADIKLSEEQYSEIRSGMANFSYSFDGNNFYDTYSYKYELQGSILQAVGIFQEDSNNNGDTSSDLKEGDNAVRGEAVGEVVSLGNQDVYTSPNAGVIIYSIDGYEDKTPENLIEDDFNQKAYKKQDLITSEKVKKGSPVYKIVTSEEWTLMVPLTDKLAAVLGDRETIRVKFNKDGESQNGALSIINIGSQKVARIDLSNGMSRYASDRFLEVELAVNTESGLKIPVSSIVTKEFYTIPEAFLTQGDNEQGQGFIRELKNKNGAVTTEFVETEIYRIADEDGSEIPEENRDDKQGYCYVNKESFREGDILKMPDSSETFTVGRTDKVKGAYSINKGFAVFRQIEIIDQNDEYCIVKPGTSYGLQAFDYIVLDGKTVDEEEILYSGIH